MAILEIGINLNSHGLIEVQYYPSLYEHDGIKIEELSNLRTNLIMVLDQFSKSVLDGEINTISFQSYNLICHQQMIALPGDDMEKDKETLLLYAITEKTTDPILVTNLLIKIKEYFLNRYSLNDIFSKKKKDF